jgi:hypothetical protein
MLLSRFMGSQGGGRRTPDESGAKLSEAGLPLGFSLKQGYRPYMEDVYVAQKFQDPKQASNVSPPPPPLPPRATGQFYNADMSPLSLFSSLPSPPLPPSPQPHLFPDRVLLRRV